MRVTRSSHIFITSVLVAGITGCVSQHEFTGTPATKNFIKENPYVIKETFSANASPTPALVNLKPFYEKDGHIATSGYIAEMHRLPVDQVGRLSCYSQAPDDLAFLYSAPWVGFWGLPVYNGYRHDVVNSLHSLHGGGPQKVADRRRKLQALVRMSFLSKQPDWQTGFLIHALADSYAHVYFKEGKLHAYNELYGHIHENLPWGDKPDSIFVNNNFQNYLEYIDALFSTLSPSEAAPAGDTNKLEEFKERIKSKASSGESMDKTAVYFMPGSIDRYADVEHSDVNCEAAYRLLEFSEVAIFLANLTRALDSDD